MRHTKPKIGDCFVIPLSDGRKAYGQYILWDDNPATGMGCLVQIFDLIGEAELPVEALRSAGLMFPPVYVGLFASIRSGRWRIIGQLPVQGFALPKFRATFGTKPGIYQDWIIWNGQTSVLVGDLPAEYRSLELRLVWGDELLEDRIVTGTNPFEKIL